MRRFTVLFALVLALAMIFASHALAQFNLVLVADIHPGSEGGGPWSLTVHDGRLFFAGDDGTHGRELWAYDNSSGEAQLVTDIRLGSNGSMPALPGDFTEFDGRLFFAANDGTHGNELWAYSHATNETQLVADIYPGDEGSAPGDEGGILVYGDRLFFDADDGIHGRELWAYDAKTGETSIVADVNPGPSPSFTSDLTIYGSALYFSALGEEGFGLWKYDGLSAPTVASTENARGLTVYEERLYFNSFDPPTGAELWAYDDATGEADIVVDLNPGSASSGPGGLTVYAGRLFFVARVGISGGEIWGFDAATGEATLVVDINSGSGGNRPRDLFAYNDRLLFSAYDDEHGYELWSYHQASDQAMLVADMRPGAIGSFPSGFAVYDEQVFFSADDGVNGSELWAATPPKVAAEDTPAPLHVSSLSIYPNPSIGVASLVLTIQGTADVAVAVYDVLGREVVVLHEGPLPAGEHTLHLDAADLPSGLYVVRAEGAGDTALRRFTVVR